MQSRVISMADIARHPRGSWAPRDYIFQVGEKVVYQEREHLVVRQQEDDLWLAAFEYVPGSRTVFSCSVPQGPTTTIYEVQRPKGSK